MFVAPKFFQINVERDRMVVGVNYYQMNINAFVDRATMGEFGDVGDDGEFLPSWSKFAAEPDKAGSTAFFKNMIRAVIGGEDDQGRDHLTLRGNVKSAEKITIKNHRVAMMWVGGNTRNDKLSIIRDLAREVLAGFEVIAVSGNEVYDLGKKKYTNRNSQKFTIEQINLAKKAGKNVLIIAANMAQRSYSIPDITELYLCYDGGSEAATIQKISRAFTPNGEFDKVSRVVSLSFDPARDDKFDALMIQAALNYQKKNDIENTRDALAEVIRTINIFRCGEEGAVRFTSEDYLNTILARNSLTRVIGKVSDVYKLTMEEIVALATGRSEVFRSEKPDAAQKGKTRLTPRDRKPNEKTEDPSVDEAKMIAKAREVIVTIVENMDVFLGMTGERTVADALQVYSADAELQNAVVEEFGVEYDVVEVMFRRGVIDKRLIDLLPIF